MAEDDGRSRGRRERLHVPPGHYYSPIPSEPDITRAIGGATAPDSAVPAQLPGIDLRGTEQLEMLASWLPAYRALPEWRGRDGRRFTYDNTWFTYADAVTYALMLLEHRPARVIEVGCGYSSALALDVDELFLESRTQFTFIDPYPDRLQQLVSRADLAGRLRAVEVQDVAPAEFTALGVGDILFIDSSHVLKAGSDVQYLLDRVLPVLAPGVLVHFHDVFYPFEYPPDWLRAGVAFNEAYAVRTLLTGGAAWRIELFHPYLANSHRDWLRRNMPLLLAGDFPTGGIWLRAMRPSQPMRPASQGLPLALPPGEC